MAVQLSVKKVEHLKDKVILLIGNDEDDYQLVVSKECYYNNHAAEGNNVDLSYISRINACDQFHQVMEAAFRFLKKRDFSSKDLENKLSKKFPDNPAVKMVIDQLVKMGYINDQKFLKNYIENRQAKHIGITKIIQELHDLGFTNFEDQLYKNGIEKDEQNAEIEGQKYIKKHSRKPPNKLITGLYNRLSSLGFEERIIMQTFKSLNLSLEESD
jgi:SOS response regulatory protein OraA/RecX